MVIILCYIHIYVFLCIQGLYDSIKQEPFKIPEDDGNDLMHTFFNPDREGWLWKQGKLIENFNCNRYKGNIGNSCFNVVYKP